MGAKNLLSRIVLVLIEQFPTPLEILFPGNGFLVVGLIVPYLQIDSTSIIVSEHLFLETLSKIQRLRILDNAVNL